MGKTSIFSKDYEKIKKKRRRRIAAAIIFIMLLTVGVLFSSDVKVWANKNLNIKSSLNIFKKKDKDEKVKGSEKVKDVNKVKKQNTEQAKPQVQEEKGYAVTLSSGNQIKLVYEEINNDKKFKYVAPETSGVSYTINPSGKNIVILDDKNQNLLCYDIDGNQTDITKKEYVSDSGTTFLKDAILTSKTGYVWHSSPKFIDDENVVYVSQLPWFNNEATKYVWNVNIKTKAHICISRLYGQKITFGDITDKGITVVVDEKTYYLKGNGEILE